MQLTPDQDPAMKNESPNIVADLKGLEKAWLWFYGATLVMLSIIFFLAHQVTLEIFASPIAEIDELVIVLIGFLSLMLIFIALYLSIWESFSVELSVDGIAKKMYFKKKQILWVDVKHVKYGMGITLIGNGIEISVNPRIFKDSNEVYRLIDRMVSFNR